MEASSEMKKIVKTHEIKYRIFYKIVQFHSRCKAVVKLHNWACKKLTHLEHETIRNNWMKIHILIVKNAKVMQKIIVQAIIEK